MNRALAIVKSLGLPERDGYQLNTSVERFPDGAHFRVEIPSVEGPVVMEAVLEEARRLGITVNRISQGSGIMMLSDAEIRSMVDMGKAEGIEVCLFIGPRMSFDTSGMASSPSGKLLGWRHAGMDQLLYALEDAYRAVDLGIRSLLIADEGLLWVINQAKLLGDLPQDLVLKVSALMSPANPVSVRLYAEMGGCTINVPGDLSLPRLSAIRQTVGHPIDLYVESPDDIGGFVRHYEIPEIVRVTAPIFLKFGLRNATGIYPSGKHLEAAAILQGKEKVHRTELGLQLLDRYFPEAVQSRPFANGLGVPV